MNKTAFLFALLLLGLTNAGAAATEPLAVPPADLMPATKTSSDQVQRPVTVSPLSAQDQADIARAEEALQRLNTLEAEFIQVTDGGATMLGSVKIQRPGRMRLTYDPPSKDFIVADGHFLNIWDGELEQSSSVPLGSSLADLILQENATLSGDIQVTKVLRGPATLAMTLVQKSDPEQGSLTLMFEDNPLQLRKWRVDDHAGRSTTVALQNIRTDVAFPSGTFTFVSPKFGRTDKMGGSL